jgi:hypothetical protein
LKNKSRERVELRGDYKEARETDLIEMREDRLENEERAS